jgi:hypothetical protein
MAKQRGKGHAEPARTSQRVVVVHVKLSVQERNALKAVLSLEGSTMQEYFAARAVERIQGMTERPRRPAPAPPSAPPPASPEHPTLAPGQTYHSVFKFFQVDITGIVRMTLCARYFKEGVGSSRPNWRWIMCFLERPKANTSCNA